MRLRSGPSCDVCGQKATWLALIPVQDAKNPRLYFCGDCEPDYRGKYGLAWRSLTATPSRVYAGETPTVQPKLL